jgi:phosphohistidine phosphatase
VRLLVVRHALAGRRDSFAETGQDDSLRPLVDRGRKRMERSSRALTRLVPEIHTLATSPLLRAVQTAEIMAATYGTLQLEQLEQLAPGGERRAVLSWLQMQPDGATVAVVGHEPDLSSLVSWLLTRAEDPFVSLKKGGACLLAWKSHVVAGDAHLDWLLTSRQLQRLAKKKNKRGSDQERQSGAGNDEPE